MIFENSLSKANFGQNIRDSPNGSLTADSRSLQTATLKYADDTTLLVKVCKNEIDLSQEVVISFSVGPKIIDNAMAWNPKKNVMN